MFCSGESAPGEKALLITNDNKDNKDEKIAEIKENSTMIIVLWIIKLIISTQSNYC